MNEEFMDKKKVDICTLMKIQRTKYGLSQKDVANAVGVAPQTYSFWERGGVDGMSIDQLYDLSRILKIDPMSFIYGIEFAYSNTWEEYFKNANFNEDELKQLMEYGDFLISKRKKEGKDEV